MAPNTKASESCTQSGINTNDQDFGCHRSASPP